MKKSSIILYWSLLLIPTIIITVIVFKLLSFEQERINREAFFSAQNRAQAIAGTIQITTETVEEELINGLFDMNKVNKNNNTTLKNSLINWEETNPLVRNVFIWKSKDKLFYPDEKTFLSQEGRSFLDRYQALFNGRIPWKKAEKDKIDHTIHDVLFANAPEIQDVKSNSSFYSKDSVSGAGIKNETISKISKSGEGRRKLLKMARTKSKPDESLKDIVNEVKTVKNSGWIPWFSNKSLYIIGWGQINDGPVYGVELEMMTLLSQFISDFPVDVPEGMVYALVDGNGHILYRSGKFIIKNSVKPDISVSLAPFLPHWQVAVFFDKNSNNFKSGKGFIILSGLLLSIFVLAIFIGGGLLTYQAHKNSIDAQQKTSFVSNVSHELKTPLTSIRMYAELLGAGRIKDEKKKKHYLNVIISESQRLTRLVNNVLNFSRLERGLKRYHIEEFEFTEYLNSIIDSQKLRMEKSNIRYEIDIPHEKIFIVSDKDATEQVLLNLIDNVVKYASDGGELKCFFELKKEFCRLEILDRGPGIPSQHRLKIFEKFHRIDNTLTTGKQGSGLGLSIAQNIMKDLGGNLIFEPRKSGGSRFVVLLPITTPNISGDDLK